MVALQPWHLVVGFGVLIVLAGIAAVVWGTIHLLTRSGGRTGR